jgi:hypothetical protein
LNAATIAASSRPGVPASGWSNKTTVGRAAGTGVDPAGDGEVPSGGAADDTRVAPGRAPRPPVVGAGAAGSEALADGGLVAAAALAAGGASAPSGDAGMPKRKSASASTMTSDAVHRSPGVDDPMSRIALNES